MVNGLQMMTTNSEQVLNRAMDREKALGVDVSGAQGELVVQPYGMTDDFGRESVTTIAWSSLHLDILADR